MGTGTEPQPITVTDTNLRRLMNMASLAAPLLDRLFELAPDEATEAHAEYTARDLRRAVEAIRAELDPRTIR